MVRDYISIARVCWDGAKSGRASPETRYGGLVELGPVRWTVNICGYGSEATELTGLYMIKRYAGFVVTGAPKRYGYGDGTARIDEFSAVVIVMLSVGSSHSVGA
jgi:hypothetical protein